ncbi:MAG: hypothetical protein IJO13_10620 [Lachnospiraceae bacterium]|nr:hypothetical protein [Lachnospiraceae bacterium]
MPSLLPSCMIPETIKTCYISVESYKDGRIKGSFQNLDTTEDIYFDDTVEMLFEMDSMLEEYLRSIANGVIDKFSFNKIESISKAYDKLHREQQTDHLCSFLIRIWFVRNAQWKGSIEWTDGDKSFDFKTIPELMSFMTEILDKATHEISVTENNG